MCGIVGVFGLPSEKHKALFTDLIILGSLRGIDSTGIAAISRKRSQIVKDTILPYQLFSTPQFKAAMTKVSTKTEFMCLIGHNRLATKGRISKAFAHPFEKGHIILVHNGTLHDRFDLLDYTKFESDSENIAHSINIKGIEETWENVRGAATIIWWDNKSKTLNMASNGLRPMYFNYTDDDKNLIWASESWMIRAACIRNGINAKESVFFPKPDIHYSFKIDNKTKVISFTANKLSTPKIRYFSLNSRNINNKEKNNWFHKDFFNRDKVGFNPITYLGPSAPKEEETNDDLFITSNNLKTQISEDEFEVFYEKCMFCGSDLKGQFKDTLLLNDSKAVCLDCVSTANADGMRVG